MKKNSTNHLNIRFEQMEKHYIEIPRFRKLLNYDKLIEKVAQRDEIIQLVENLKCGLSENELGNTVEKILNTVDEDDFDLLIIAGHKFTYPNTVQLLKNVGYPKNKKALPSLILLLQDLNWPGAFDGMNVLKEADTSILMPMLELAITEAFSSNDFIWLGGIKHFLEFAHINKTHFIDSTVYKLLEYADY